MKTTIVRSSWLKEYGNRLDCQPYAGGALEARQHLASLSLRKDRLADVTSAILNIGRVKRNWVESAEYGVPFLSGSSIQLADISGLPFISNQAVKDNPALIIEKSTILITRSGSIGKMAYTRTEMVGTACTEDVLRVVPDPAKIPPGFLYAFLCSKYGVPLVAAGTYGAIIQHLEPEHIADLGVPRLAPRQEQEIHRLVEEAGELRTEAAKLKAQAIALFHELCGIADLPPLQSYSTPHLGQISLKSAQSRIDCTYHVKPYTDARHAFDNCNKGITQLSLREAADVFVPTIFKREYADDKNFGYPYITGADVFNLSPSSEQYLLREVAHENRLVLESGMILIQEAGQRYGLLGKSVMVGRTLTGFACTNNMVRIRPIDSVNAGYIFAVLSSPAGVRLIKREAAGSSIPHLDAERIGSIRIPWPDESIRNKISRKNASMIESLDVAVESERKAEELLLGHLA